MSIKFYKESLSWLTSPNFAHIILTAEEFLLQDYSPSPPLLRITTNFAFSCGFRRKKYILLENQRGKSRYFTIYKNIKNALVNCCCVIFNLTLINLSVSFCCCCFSIKRASLNYCAVSNVTIVINISM